MTKAFSFIVAALVACSHQPPRAPDSHGRVTAALVHSEALAANLLGDPADDRVMIFLPPGYDSTATRYPVLYLLHGYTQDERAFLDGRFQGLSIETAAPPFIVVMPRSLNAYGGTPYVNSPVTGRWEDFLVGDLVPWVDAHFRTLPAPERRGIAGYSLGAFSALRLALRHPDLFGAVYALSPAWLEDEVVQDLPPGAGESVHTREDLARATFADRAAIAISAAFADEAGPPPLFVDVTARQRWIQHLPVENGRRLLAIAIDYGSRDEFAHLGTTARDLATKLRAAGAVVEVDEYDGSHSSRIGERVTAHLLPFFQRLLAAP